MRPHDPGRPRRLVAAVPAFLLAAALAANPAAADKPKLSDAVQQAAKPAAGQQVIGVQPSDSKTKAGDPATDAPQAAPESAPPAPEPPVNPGGAFLYLPEPGWPRVDEVRIPQTYGRGAAGSVLAAGDETLDPAWLRAGLTAGAGGARGAALESYAALGLLLGVSDGPWALDLRGTRSAGSLDEDLDDAMDGMSAWSGDLALRLRLTPPRSRMGADLVLTGRLGRYGWRYANAIAVQEGAGVRRVSRDSLPYHALLAGLGAEALRAGNWSLWLTASGGVQRFGDDTGAGFGNDLFRDRGIFDLTLDLVHAAGRAAVDARAGDADIPRPRR